MPRIHNWTSFRRLVVMTLPVTLLAAGVALVTVPHSRAHDDATTAWLGVSIEEEIDHREGGARITRVVDESPAAGAGLEAGDVIVRFDGEVVRGPRALTRRVHEREPGDRVEVVVLRDGRERIFDIELGERETRFHVFVPDFDFNFEGLEDLDQLEHLDRLEHLDVFENLEGLHLDLGDLGDRIREQLRDIEICEDGDCRRFVWHSSSRPLLGVHISETTPELREHLGGSEDSGVLISKILPGMPAEEAGMRVGDLITAIDGESVATGRAIRRALADKAGEIVTVDLVRDGSPMSVQVQLPEPEEPATGPRAFYFEHDGFDGDMIERLHEQIGHTTHEALEKAREATETSDRARRKV